MTHTTDIERVLRGGRRLRARLLDIKHSGSALGYLRVGIVVPKFGFTAVRRNRLKRQLRELVRQRLLLCGASRDLIIRARREAYAASFNELRDDIDGVPRQLDAPA